jgi:aryl-alcohol dehydrogenase-like predicted oxidoreductase
MQNYYNLLYREEEREMLPLCADQGMGVVPWSPLARGMLAGTRHRDGARETTRGGNDTFADELYTDEDFDVVDAVRAVAGARGLPPAQVSLAWLLSRPTVTAPIVGATKLTHVEDAVAATEVTLSAEEIAALEAPYRPHEVLPKR